MTETKDSTLSEALTYQLDKVLKDGGSLELFVIAGGSVIFKQQCAYRFGKDYLAIVGVTGNVDILPLSAITRCQQLK